MLGNAQEEYLCHGCVADAFLKAEIKATNHKHRCMQCGKTRAAMEFCALSERVDAAIFEHYAPSLSGDGQTFAELVEEQAGIDAEIAEAMQSWFSRSRGYRAAKDGDDNLYSETVGYVEAGVSAARYQEGWRTLQRSIRRDARYFNAASETWLDDLFEDVPTLTNWQGQSLIDTWEPGQVQLVRGRVAKNEADLQRYLANPAAELGSPPTGLSAAGRMNAAGVSVFYGAFDMPTCRAEIRPPAGSHAVFARFEIIRPVRILSLEALAYAQIEGSIFDPSYSRRIERVAFLRRFDDEISQPVMPGDEAFGYLVTQVIADYLAQKLGLDGVRFKSTQAGRHLSMSGHAMQNVALFSHAARVEPIDTSGLRTEVRLGSLEDHDSSLSITDYVLPKRRKARKKLEESIFEIVSSPSTLAYDDLDNRRPALRYVPDSVGVQYIHGTDYDVTDRRLSRSRLTRADVAKWQF